jgi:predicted O-methyltransferase YrrM
MYLDTDVLIRDDVNSAFDRVTDDILYVLEEGVIDSDTDFWGKSLFGNELANYPDKNAFSSGIMLFNTSEKIRALFKHINEDIAIRPHHFHDQPHIVYNAFKYGMFDSQILKDFAVNNDHDICSGKIIHHFPGKPGIYEHKINHMMKFLNKMKIASVMKNIDDAKKYIDQHLMPIINGCGELLEGNIFMFHHTTTYTNQFLNKAKNISNMVLNRNVRNVMEIGFNSGFSTLLMLLSNPHMKISCFDLGEHSYTMPCFNKLKETFGDRLQITIGDSCQTLRQVKDVTYDLIHIDGGHSTEVAESDILNCYRLSKKGGILIMDDYDFPNLHQLWDKYIRIYGLQELEIGIFASPHHDIKKVV